MTKKKESVQAVSQSVVEGTEKSVDQVRLEGILGRLRDFMKDEGISITPKMRYMEQGIVPDIEIKLLDNEVKNVYDEAKDPVA